LPVPFYTPSLREAKTSKRFFFREKRSKKASRLWLGAAATGEAHPPLSETPKVG
jgi:hypothetical protein